MSSKVLLFSTAEDDLASFPKEVQKRIAHALQELTLFPGERVGVRALKPPFDGYRKRVGDYRILFDYEHETVFVHRIKNRKDAYR